MPSYGLVVYRRFERSYSLHLKDPRVSQVTGKKEPSTLKFEVVRSSETSVNLYKTTRCHSPEDKTLHNSLRFDVLTFVNVKTVFRDVTSCSLEDNVSQEPTEKLYDPPES
jgi:hypothetical protein